MLILIELINTFYQIAVTKWHCKESNTILVYVKSKTVSYRDWFTISSACKIRKLKINGRFCFAQTICMQEAYVLLRHARMNKKMYVIFQFHLERFLLFLQHIGTFPSPKMVNVGKTS